LRGGGTLHVPAGDYYIHYPEIARDMDPHEASNKQRIQSQSPSQDKLLVVPAGVVIEGAPGEGGRPATRIHWRESSVPLLSFVRANGAGIRNIAFVFDGVQPQFFPFQQEQYLDSVGYHTRWLGGPYEMSAVVYAIESNNLRFENLTFQSSKADNEHTFAFGIVLKGQSSVPPPERNSLKQMTPGTRVPGGGLSACSSGTSIRSVHFEDYVMGILASGQCNLTIENVSGDHRGSWYRSFDPTRENASNPTEFKNVGPPGHLIYLTFQIAYDVTASPDDRAIEQRVFHSTARNSNVTIQNITEGGNTLSNFNSLGTLSLKNIQGGTVRNISSQHPAGLIQSIVDAHDVTFENLRWSSDRNLCTEAQTKGNCGVPIITLEPGPPDSPNLAISSDIHFSNVQLESRGRVAEFKVSQEAKNGLASRDIRVDGLTIACNPFRQGNTSPDSIISVHADGGKFDNVSYTPEIPAGAQGVNTAAAARIESSSKDVTINMTIHQTAGAPSDAYRTVVEQGANGCHINRRLDHGEHTADMTGKSGL
jgi:hypothetical protein